MAGTVLPYRDTASPTVVAWMDRYKAKYGNDPNIGAVYGHALMDQLIFALDKAGKDLTVDRLITAMESIKGYRDIFGGPVVSYGPDRHQGSNESFLFQVRKGRFEMVAGPVNYGS